MFNKRLTTVILTGVVAVLLFAKASVGSESSVALSEQHRDVVQVLDEAYEGQSEAQLALAYRYLSGDGVEQNDEKAAQSL